MNKIQTVKYWLPITVIGIVAISVFGYIAINSTLQQNYKGPTNENSAIDFTPTGVEALDLNVNAVKIITENQSKIQLLEEGKEYAYDGFISRDNETNIDVIFTIYDKTNSSLTKIPNIDHGPEFIKILDDFIIYVNEDKMLGVYARK